MARTRQPSRADRWSSAVADAREALQEVQSAAERFTEAMEALADVQSEYQDWLDNLPDGLRSSPVGDKLETVTGLDLSIEIDTSEAESAVDEAEGADLPLGWGRD